MESRAKLLGHPVHQMLVVFPLGLLGMAVIFDVIVLGLRNGYWSEIALWMIVAGIATGLMAAPFGLLDWLGDSVRDPREADRRHSRPGPCRRPGAVRHQRPVPLGGVGVDEGAHLDAPSSLKTRRAA